MWKTLVMAVGAVLVGTGIVLLCIQGSVPEGTDDPFWLGRVVRWLIDLLIVAAGVGSLVYARLTLGTPGDDLRYVLRHHRRKVAVAFGLGMAVAVLGAAEIVFYFVNRYTVGHPELRGSFFRGDALLGSKPAANFKGTVAKLVNGRTIYEATYTIGPDSRRVTPSSGADRPGPVVLFFGCSYTFGEGVNDDETMPHYFGLRAPEAAVHNYGFSGYGPQQMLALLDSGTLDDVIAGKSVIAIYTYFDDHVRRAIGAMRCVGNWAAHFPCYELDRNDRVVRRGSFLSSRPVTSLLYAILWRSQILRFAKVDLPVKLRDGDYRLVARMIEESARHIASRSRRSRFYVVFYPGTTTVAKMTPLLQGAGVHLLDYTKLLDRRAERYRIRDDGHPTPLAHRTVAEKLADDVLP